MHTKRIKTALVALTTAGLLAAGAAAYADDDMTLVQGGKGGFALSGNNDANYNQATSGDVNPEPGCVECDGYGSGGAYGGSANNTQNTTCAAPAFTFAAVAAVQGINVCPNVGPILSKQEGGDAEGGDIETGDVTQNNNAGSSAEANGGSAYVGHEEKAKPAKEKKAKKKKSRKRHGRQH